MLGLSCCSLRGKIVDRLLLTLPRACALRRPHHFLYEPPWFAMDEYHRRQDEPIFPEGRGSVDKIAVHHYVTKCAPSITATTSQTCISALQL